MTVVRVPLVVLVALLFAPVTYGQVAAPAARPALTAEQMEAFLLNARIDRVRPAGDGVTNSRRATLTDGQLTHDAHIQIVDEARAIFQTDRGTELNFRDTFRYNIAGYRLARLLGLDNVPMSVARRFQGADAAFTWWVDDVAMDEGDREKNQARDPDASRMASNIHIMRVFDELIYNTDRNLGNLLWTNEWKMWLIDHTRAFRLSPELRRPQTLERVERGLFQAMKALTRDSVTEAADDSLSRQEIDALLTRRDVIVKFFDGRIAERGEAAVLYTRR